MRKFLLFFILISTICGLIGITLKTQNISLSSLVNFSKSSKNKVTNWKDYHIVQHALGSLNGYVYTNTKEALITNYNKGSRVFEVDLILTEDNKLVACHDAKTYIKNAGIEFFDEVSFLTTSTHEGLTNINFYDLINLMKEYPDIFIVTDTKYIDKERIQREFDIIYNIAKDIDIKILDRIIPQIYHSQMFDYIEEIYSFKEYIYTLYKKSINLEEVYENVVSNKKITAITLPYSKISEELIIFLNNLNVKLYTHTINNIEQMNELHNLNIHGFYSDDIAENYLIENNLLQYAIN